jgi:hypothetical protein
MTMRRTQSGFRSLSNHRTKRRRFLSFCTIMVRAVALRSKRRFSALGTWLGIGYVDLSFSILVSFSQCLQSDEAKATFIRSTLGCVVCALCAMLC